MSEKIEVKGEGAVYFKGKYVKVNLKVIKVGKIGE